MSAPAFERNGVAWFDIDAVAEMNDLTPAQLQRRVDLREFPQPLIFKRGVPHWPEQLARPAKKAATGRARRNPDPEVAVAVAVAPPAKVRRGRVPKASAAERAAKKAAYMAAYNARTREARAARVAAQKAATGLTAAARRKLAPEVAAHDKAVNSAYKSANRQAIAIKQAAYRAANREAIAAYRAANREAISARMAAYYATTRDARVATAARRDAKYRAEHGISYQVFMARKRKARKAAEVES